MLNNTQHSVRLLMLIAGLMLMANVAYNQNSVLQTGTWYKVAVKENGVYKIDYNQFKKMGFDPSKTDPRKIKIYGNPGGMLPQSLSEERPTDLTENSIFVQGESDGKFNSGDYILFYAQGADHFHYDVKRETFYYEKNLYADENYYFVTISTADGKRILPAEDLGPGFPVINQGENLFFYELDRVNELKSGRDWFGEKFDLTTEYTFPVDLSGIMPGSTLKLVSDVMAQSFGSTSFKVFLNDVEVAQQNMVAIPNTQYGIKGRDRRDTIQVAANIVNASTRSSQQIRYQYIKSPSGFSIGYLDYFLLKVTQKLARNKQQTSFRSSASLLNPITRYELEESSAQAQVWDVTNPTEPRLQSTTFASNKLSFSAESEALREFVVFTPSCPSPELIGKVPNQNLHGISTPEFLIVAHPDVKDEAVRLAQHRSTFSSMSSAVVTTEEIYHEFSSGRQDVTAIRDFIKYLYDQNSSVLKAVLLFGKGSYDFKNRISNNVNLVPTYESRNSLHPLLTYSSDDYFGFLDDTEGHWGEEPAVNHSMDIAVGRIPVKNLTDAKNVVDKIVRYDTDKKLLGRWRKDLVFIADDGDFNLHQEDANELTESIESNHAEFNIKKIYLDQFEQVSRPSGKVSPDANAAIQEIFANGALVINYTGHGSERLWAQERIFDDIAIEQLKNERLPLLITATCEFGRQDDPVFMSGAELCMLRKNSGAIGLVTTARPVNAATNFLLNEAFYNSFFEQENNKFLSIGEIFMRTKNTSLSGVANRNFSLIGDPSLRLAMPTHYVSVTEVKTVSGSTTLMALSTVSVKGRITDGFNNLVTDFNGVIDAVLFDKETPFVTLGEENQPFPYNQWYNSLFRGKASVVNGEFEFQFVVPKNIAYPIGEGKLSLYAYDSENGFEASGYSKDFEVGSSEPDPVEDTTPPQIQVFISDTTFQNGGAASANTRLVARLMDDHGINISGYGIGNSIIATLDGFQTFILNNYYESDLDDYTQGTISFPLTGLAAGKHFITVKAWDTHNNPVEGSVEFVVTNGDQLTLEKVGNFPNPFRTSTTLFFTHNRSGDDLQASIVIYDNQGQAIFDKVIDVPFSSYQVNLLELSRDRDFLVNRAGHIYFVRLSVRSLTNGSKSEQVTKLILTN